MPRRASLRTPAAPAPMRAGALACALSCTLACTLAWGAAACGGRRTTGSAGGEVVPAELPAVVSLRVENRNYNDVVVWLERPGNRTRLGSVVGSSQTVFAIPARLWQTPEGIWLAAEMAGQRSVRAGSTADRGDRRAVSERLFLSVGQRIVWTLESGLQRSHLGVQ